MVTVKDVFFSFGKKEVLKGISLEIKTGEIVGLVGPNGVGKTTLIKLLSGLIPESKEKVEFQNESIYSLVEQPSFFQDMTGRENIEYFLNKKLDSEDVDKAPFGCKEFIDKPVKKYSMGMKQRLALWMIMMSDADILLLDEPSVSLDVDSVNELDKCLTEIKTKRGILISSHNFNELQNTCDRVLIMENGKIIKEINSMNEPRDLYKICLLGRISADSLKLLSDEGIPMEDNIVRATGTEKEIAGLVRRLILTGSDVCEVKKYRNMLELSYQEALMNGEEIKNEKRTEKVF